MEKFWLILRFPRIIIIIIMVCIVHFTAANENEAKKISGCLVKERLVACSIYWPVGSIYSWKGKVVKNKEFAVFLKTERRLFKKIVARIRQLHSYELPNIEMIDSATYPEIAKWVRESCK